MERITFYSTNNKTEKANFRQAFMNGLASNYGLYMFRRDSVPKLDMEAILAMKELNYAGIAYKVLAPFLREDINPQT
jgi:threonine synthase